MVNLKKQRIIFWLSLTILCILSFYTYTNTFEFSKLNEVVSINLQQLLILLTVGGLVGTLYFSKKYAIKLRSEKNREIRLRKYNFMVYLRLGIFDLLCLLCLFMHIFTINSGSHLIFGMIIIMFLFIWPSKNRAIYETNDESKEKVVNSVVTEIEDKSSIDENSSKSIK